MHIEWPNQYEHVDTTNEGVEVLEAPCKDEVAYKMMSPYFACPMFNIVENNWHYCTTWIIAKLNSIGFPSLILVCPFSS